MTAAIYHMRETAFETGIESARQHLLLSKGIIPMPKPKNPYHWFSQEYNDWQQGFDETFLKYQA